MFNNLPVWAYLFITLFLTHLTIISVTVFLHRHQAHRALSLHPAVSHLFHFWLWLTTGMVTKQWVAIHRKHHAFVETSDDPHSPRQEGIFTVLLQGAELYREEAKNTDTMVKFGHETPDDWIERYVYSAWPGLGISLMFILDLLLFGAIGITIWAIQMIWIPFFAAGVINGLGHWWGYRNFESADGSTNIVPIAMLIGGEELHNNHHAFASSARFSNKWYELDLGWFYICLLQYLGLAQVRKMAPVPHLDCDKSKIDMDTVQAIISNRLHVMSDYSRAVVKRVYREEKSRADIRVRRMLRKARRLLIKHEFLLDASAIQRLDQVFANSDQLKIVYDFRQQLQQVWQEKTASQEKLLQSLQEWCQEAEATGIKALQDFAEKLRWYSIEPALQPVRAAI